MCGVCEWRAEVDNYDRARQNREVSLLPESDAWSSRPSGTSEIAGKVSSATKCLARIARASKNFLEK